MEKDKTEFEKGMEYARTLERINRQLLIGYSCLIISLLFGLSLFKKWASTNELVVIIVVFLMGVSALYLGYSEKRRLNR